jgi:hypothetical protein
MLNYKHQPLILQIAFRGLCNVVYGFMPDFLCPLDRKLHATSLENPH